MDGARLDSFPGGGRAPWRARAGVRLFLLVPPLARNTGLVEVVTDFASLVNHK